MEKKKKKVITPKFQHFCRGNCIYASNSWATCLPIQIKTRVVLLFFFLKKIKMKNEKGAAGTENIL
jgi:hypothetical protein